jgi:hypothetical protein
LALLHHRLGSDLAPKQLDAYLAAHLIDPALLRADNFDAFMSHRQAKLLALIEKAMGKAVYRADAADESEQARVRAAAQ